MVDAPKTEIAQYPRASNGKRNWSHAAVHGNAPRPSRETIPEGKFGLADLLDIINPLQHIPIVGQAYRALTGDTLGTPARIFGGLLFGGPAGLLQGVGSAMLSETGASERALAMIGYGKSSEIKDSAAAAQSGALNIKI